MAVLLGVVEFHDYAIADGIATLFRRFGKWHGREPEDGDPEASASSNCRSSNRGEKNGISPNDWCLEPAATLV